MNKTNFRENLILKLTKVSEKNSVISRYIRLSVTLKPCTIGVTFIQVLLYLLGISNLKSKQSTGVIILIACR